MATLQAVDAPLSAPTDWENPPDNEASRHAVQWIQRFPLTEDEGLEQGWTLGRTWMPWQDRLTRHIYGTRRADGRRQFETIYVEMPKKSGKSHYCAAVMLYELFWGAPGGQLYSAAYDLNQAMVVWGIAKDMVELSPSLRAKVQIRNYPGHHEIEYLKKGSVYEPITRRAASKHGINPSAVCFDELHEQPDRELWDTIDDSMGARREPLMLAITNAGHDRTSLCYRQREYAMALNRGEFTDPSFLGVVYGADPEEDDPWEPETWRKANPGLGTTVRMDWLSQKAEQARRMPTKQNAFKRWQLGIWTEQETKWINPDDWDRCQRGYGEDDLVGLTCYGGLDLGSVSDLSAWVLLFEDPESDALRVLCRAWCPEARLTDESNPYREHYQVWEREGWLDVERGRVMSTDAIEARIVEDVGRYNFVDMAMDRKHQGIDLSTRLETRHGLEVAGMGTGTRSMSAPCTEFEERLLAEEPRILHRGNPVLTWAIQNVALKQMDDDKKMPTKDSEDAKIDPVVALLMALDRAMRHETVESVGWLLNR